MQSDLTRSIVAPAVYTEFCARPGIRENEFLARPGIREFLLAHRAFARLICVIKPRRLLFAQFRAIMRG